MVTSKLIFYTRAVAEIVGQVPDGFEDPIIPSPRVSPQGSPTDRSSCGTCNQRLPFMTDPRKLPCSHMFCYPCLQSQFAKLGVVNCSTCG